MEIAGQKERRKRAKKGINVDSGSNSHKLEVFKEQLVENNLIYQSLLEKYPTLFFFCEYLVDFNEARLH